MAARTDPFRIGVLRFLPLTLLAGLQTSDWLTDPPLGKRWLAGRTGPGGHPRFH